MASVTDTTGSMIDVTTGIIIIRIRTAAATTTTKQQDE